MARRLDTARKETRIDDRAAGTLDPTDVVITDCVFADGFRDGEAATSDPFDSIPGDLRARHDGNTTADLGALAARLRTGGPLESAIENARRNLAGT